MILAAWSTKSLDEVAAANEDGIRWFQLTLLKDDDLIQNLIQRAEKAGYSALVISVDVPGVLGKRLVKETLSLPKHLTLANFKETGDHFNLYGNAALKYYGSLMDSSATWARIDWIRAKTSLPLILKGICNTEDAQEALTHNIQGIIVSNHGGRQLDGVPAAVC